MATGATGQLGLALPVQGELSGTWGDTVNNGLTQYTNIAIAGTLTLTGDGAVTLANTTGDASASNITSTLAGAGTVTAQFAMVRVSGTTVAKTVTGPSYSKSYIIDNASSFSVTFKASGQTGVSISPGEKVGVYYNGTDYVKIGGGGITYGAVKTTTYTAVANDGVLTDTTGGAFTVNLPATPATGTQVFIADSAGTWATNNLTIGRNGSTIAGSATDLVCDINSVSIQCIYDGTTWDIFAQIGANDTAVVTLNGTQTLTNKTLTSPTITGTGAIAAATVTLSSSLTLNGGTANGVAYLNGSKVVTSGSALVFDGTNLGVLAGSVTTPASKLHVVGPVRSSNSAGTLFSSLASDGIYASGTDLYLVAPTGYSNIFYANNVERMRLPVAGGLKTSTTISVGNATPAASGAGITFPASQDASSDANTLDDYEEGTWTPGQGSGLTVIGTYTGVGRYTKIGRVVTISGYVSATTSVVLASGGQLCTNLPFAQNDDTYGVTPLLSSENQAGNAFVLTSAITGSSAISTAASNIKFSATYYV